MRDEKRNGQKKRQSAGGSAGKKRMVLLSCIAVLLLTILPWCLWSFYSSKYSLTVTFYSLDTGKLEDTLRIVQLSDLHSHEFGEDNEELLEQVGALEPDLIFCTGDMINAGEDNSEMLQKLLENLTRIAPVYFSLGNHEIAYMENHGSTELEEEVASAGAVYLNGTWEDVTLEGIGTVRIGGMYRYAFCPEEVSEEEYAQDRTAQFLKTYEDTDALRLLLVHRPDSFCFGDAGERWHVDLIFSGHAHGGQVRLPLLGGVYGGDLGWFSEYVDGLHTLGNCHMVISRGLGSSPNKIPRWNNIPEILVMDVR